MNENNSLRWSDEQVAIFNWFESGRGNLVVQARAGTGKTTTIKEAFSHAPEEKMLYAVFNKKNQVEAQEKIQDGRVQVKTLHSLGYAYIRRSWNNVRPDDKVEWDRVDAALGMHAVSSEARAEVHQLVGFAKNMTINPSLEDLVELAQQRDLGSDELSSREVASYARQVLEASKVQRKDGRISFNDMVYLPVALGIVRPWFNLVVVDEAQDMNLPQLVMAQQACKRNGRICVVGDNRQAIYGFRGACQDGMEMMRQVLGAQTLGLTVTYRCPSSVVALAQQIVPDYKAAPEAPLGCVRGMTQDSMMELVKPGDAVLSRANAPLMPMCLSLLRQRVPAMIEGRDVGAALVKLAKKMKARSVPEFLAKVKSWEERMVKRAMKADTSDTEKKVAEYQDQAACLVAVSEEAKSIDDVLSRLENLFRDSEKERRPMVVLSSVHKAKGLEWDRVFMLRETFLRVRKGQTSPSLEEENIYYVAVTRAKQILVEVT